jgi:hypothetical protein
MGKMKNAHTILIGKSQWKRPLQFSLIQEFLQGGQSEYLR